MALDSPAGSQPLRGERRWPGLIVARAVNVLT